MDEPTRILSTTENVYASTIFYQDAGRVTVTGNGVLAGINTIHFCTAFARPDRFRFEFRYRHHPAARLRRFVLWSHGHDVRIVWTGRPVKREDSLSNGISAAAGVSYGAVRAIAPMLMPESVAANKAIDLTSLVRLDPGTIDGVRCQRVLGQRSARIAQGTGQSGADLATTLWIDEETYLLRRVESGLGGGSLSARVVIDLSPTLIPVSEESLRLMPSEPVN